MYCVSKLKICRVVCFYFVIQCILLTERAADLGVLPPPPLSDFRGCPFWGKNKVYLFGHLSVNLPTTWSAMAERFSALDMCSDG